MRRHEIAVSMKRLALLLASFLEVAFGSTYAQPVESLESIQSTAESYVQSQLPVTRGKYYVTASRLDSRLRLADCTNALDVFVANNGTVQSRTTVGVRCADADGWTVYVPVAIEVEAQVLVLRRALARRARIEAMDVELQTRRLPGISANFLNDVSSLQGRRLRRALAAGTPLTTDVLDRDVLVQRGQNVTLIASTGGIEIRAQGRALSQSSEQDRTGSDVNSPKIVEDVVEKRRNGESRS
jgi:flagellar basal body P-ring formation protein FlgA